MGSAQSTSLRVFSRLLESHQRDASLSFREASPFSAVACFQGIQGNLVRRTCSTCSSQRPEARQSKNNRPDHRASILDQGNRPDQGSPTGSGCEHRLLFIPSESQAAMYDRVKREGLGRRALENRLLQIRREKSDAIREQKQCCSTAAFGVSLMSCSALGLQSTGEQGPLRLRDMQSRVRVEAYFASANPATKASVGRHSH